MEKVKVGTNLILEIETLVERDVNKYDILHKICTILREEAVKERIKNEIPGVIVESIQAGFTKVNIEYDENQNKVQ